MNTREQDETFVKNRSFRFYFVQDASLVHYFENIL